MAATTRPQEASVNIDRDDLVCPGCGLSQPGAQEGARCPDDGRYLVPAAAVEACPDDEVLGTLVAGRFAVVGIIGVGGFGAVYRAIQQPVGRAVALKLIRPRLEGVADVKARFLREARVVASLNDPSIVTLYDYGQADGGALFMAFELVEGWPLSRIMADGPMRADRVAPIILQVLRALAVAHRRGLIHRDIKPANIMIRPDEFGRETVKVLDFGIAKALHRAEDEEASLETRDGVLLGTPRYMAPEQARNEGVDARTDLYALGVVTYEMLAGRPPFSEGPPLEVVLAHIMRAPPPFDDALGVPPGLGQVVFTALAKAPDDRFPAAVAMAEALVQALPDIQLGTSVFDLVSGSSEVRLPTGGATGGGIDTSSREFVGEALGLGTDPTMAASPELLAPLPGPASSSPRWLWPAVAGLVVFALAGWWLATRRPPPGAPDAAAAVTVPDAAPAADAAPDAAVADAAKPDVPDAALDAEPAAAPDAAAAAPPRRVRRPPRPPRAQPTTKPEAPASLQVPEF
ncbi:MAG: serine/threonine protein kinase [Myxococcales bacterium]|nr:serine/threonine protein kinase [Myxococcales bacterium]